MNNLNLNIKNTFNKELPADSNLQNNVRQVYNACFSYVTPLKTKKPTLLHVSEEMLLNLGLSIRDSQTKEFLNVFTGNLVLPNSKPYAMCYGGHQFGNWAGQLGDGRAINLAEVLHQNKRWTLQLKGAGKTPYSRTADGLAVLRSSIREYLCSEAMHHLGVPTTRALSLALTGNNVLRDMLYNGNPAYEKGAVVCRVAPSFIRFGSYQIFASRQDIKTLKTLVDYTIKHFFPHLGLPSKETYLAFFNEVQERTIDMLIHWQRVGFVHGVMNTDNMSILGLTIDYGPYGWLENYDHGWTPNTTDNNFKRYRYGQQLEIGLWNLYQLANALYPLIEDVNGLENILHSYSAIAQKRYSNMMASKIGIFTEDANNVSLITLIKDLETNLQLTETDMTIFFRNLADFKKEQPSEWFKVIKDAFYNTTELTESVLKRWEDWFNDYSSQLKKKPLIDKERKLKMNKINPKYVLRNYMAQLAIDKADDGDYYLIDEFYQLLKKPYAEQPKYQKWFNKRPEWARHKVGCSMLSCSS